MAVEGLSTAQITESAEVVGATGELRALLVGYSHLLGTIEDCPAVLWARPEKLPRFLRWWRFPAPRALVRSLLVRHISRCVGELSRRAARRVALADDAPGPLRDLKMLERFEQSLPPGPKLRLIAPLALLGALLVAYIWAVGSGSSLRTLLAGLTRAAVDLNRGEAVDAFKTAHVQPHLYLGVAVFIAWSVVLISLPLVPAFSIKRQMLQGCQGVEAQGFAAFGCPRVHDFEPDLFAQVLLIAEVAVIGAGMVAFAPLMVHDFPFRGFMYYYVLTIFYLTGVGLLCLTAAAAVELRGRYAERRVGVVRQRSFVTRASLRLALGIAVFLFINQVIHAV